MQVVDMCDVNAGIQSSQHPTLTVKSKVSYGQELSSGESTPTAGGVNYNCSNDTEVAKWATPSCSRSQTAMDNGVRDGSSN